MGYKSLDKKCLAQPDERVSNEHGTSTYIRYHFIGSMPLSGDQSEESSKEAESLQGPFEGHTKIWTENRINDRIDGRVHIAKP